MKTFNLESKEADAFVTFLIKYYLMDHDDNVPEMAKKFGVSKDTIWAILSGKCQISVRTFLPKLFRYYSLSTGFKLIPLKREIGIEKKVRSYGTTSNWDPVEQMSWLLHGLMKDSGLSTSSMAKFCGLSQPGVKSVISGDHFPRKQTVQAILRPFGYTCVLEVCFRDNTEHKRLLNALTGARR